jgi:error-prone DNA polymerase
MLERVDDVRNGAHGAPARERSGVQGAPRATEPGCGAEPHVKWFCNNCSYDWAASVPGGDLRAFPRFASLDDLIARTGLRRDEVVTLADIGALNSFGYDRRSALWQAERAVRPTGELFGESESELQIANCKLPISLNVPAPPSALESPALPSLPGASEHPVLPPQPAALAHPALPDASGVPDCPLRPMTEAERLTADYAGMGLTVGRHPMAFRREELATRGILRASDLQATRQGRRVRVAGMVITRQRPGTAKGFVFLTLEDETGIANIIVRPDLFARDRLVIIEEPFLIIEGVLQSQDGVTSIRAEQVRGMRGVEVDFNAHDFY